MQALPRYWSQSKLLLVHKNMSEHAHFTYKNDAEQTVENDLKALAEQLPPDTFCAVYAVVQKSIDRATTPLLARIDAQDRELATLKARLGAVEEQQQTNNGNIHGAFNAIGRLTNDVAILKGQDGPGTLDQQEQIAVYLKKKPDHRGTYGELRDLLGVTASRFSQIIKNAGFTILQHRYDKRRRSLKLPVKF